MVTSIVVVATLVGDAGLSMSAARAPKVSARERSALFWTNLGIGMILSVIMIITSPFIAKFYGNPEIELICKVLSTVFLINGAMAQYRSDLMRKLQFGSIAIGDVCGQVVGLTTATIIALNGGGYWAIVFSQIAIPATTSIVLVMSGRWSPGPPFRRVSIRRFLPVGIGTMATQLLNTASTSIGPVMLGRLYGPAAAGLFSRGFQVFNISVQQLATPLTSVAVPVFARVQDDRVRLQSYGQTAQRLVSYILGAAICMVAIGGESLVAVVLGTDWRYAGTVVQILAIGGLFQVVGYVNYWLFLAAGSTRVLLYCEGVSRIVMIALIVVLSNISFEAGVAGYAIGLFLVWLSSTFLGLPRIGISPKKQIGASFRPVLMYGFAFLMSVVGKFIATARNGNDWEILLWSYGLAFSVLLLFLLLPDWRRDLRDAVLKVRTAIGR